MSGLFLALESSTYSPGVAVGEGNRILRHATTRGRAHASDLLACADAEVVALGRAPGDVSVVVVGIGPGSYTGLRVGVATALGVARSTGAALVAIPTSEALAYAHLSDGEEGVHLYDIRAGHVAFSHYRREGEELATLRAPVAIPRVQLEDALPAHARVLADGGTLGALGLEARAQPCDATAEDVLRLGFLRHSRNGAGSTEAVRPLYLRPFEAAVRRR